MTTKLKMTSKQKHHSMAEVPTSSQRPTSNIIYHLVTSPKIIGGAMPIALPGYEHLDSREVE